MSNGSSGIGHESQVEGNIVQAQERWSEHFFCREQVVQVCP
jgi:hypothetical protein